MGVGIFSVDRAGRKLTMEGIGRQCGFPRMIVRLFSVAMRVAIPETELRVRATRAGGPGGQHVNKTATRVEVFWNIAASPSLTEAQRDRLLDRLKARLDSEGVLRVVASDSRSQIRNRETAIVRLHELINQALAPVKKRIPTKRPAAAVESRLTEKRKQSEKKNRRKPITDNE